ncbi:MAG: hypothetical protein WAV05_06170 [Anaerolineales bacterium]
MSSDIVRPIKFHLRIEYLWGLTALIGIFIFVNTHPIRPHDFWWHITIGRDIVTTGKIPTVDVFSYTEAGQPYPSYQIYWLMEIMLYEIYKLGGPALVIFIHGLIITAAYSIIFWICKGASNSWRMAAFGVIFAAALGLNDWNVRPQGITFLIASFFLLAIYHYNKSLRRHWLIILPLGMLVWVNSHGTFIIGLVVVGIWWGQILWEAIKKRIILKQRFDQKSMIIPSFFLVITALVCLFNPRGVGIIDYVKTLTSNSVVQNLVTEWAPPTLNTLMGAIFLFGLMGSAVILALSPKRPDLYQISSFLFFGVLGLKTSRGIVWFGIMMAPIMAEHLSAIFGQLRKTEQRPATRGGSRIVNTLFVLLITTMGVISLPWLKGILPLPAAKAGLISAETPVQATEFLLEQKPPGHVFNAMSFGSYLIWAAYPDYQVFVDSRIELFSEKVWMDYINISDANGDWETLLKEYGVNTLMLSPREQRSLVEAAQKSNGWMMIYLDPIAIIFEQH